jgi:hypothetical protein
MNLRLDEEDKAPLRARYSTGSAGHERQSGPRYAVSLERSPDRLAQVGKTLCPGLALALAVRSHIRTKLGVSGPPAVLILPDGHRHLGLS